MNKIERLRAEINDLRSTFDHRVAQRADLMFKAQLIAPNVVLDAGMSDDEIRARAVAYTKGRSAIDGKSSVYIEAAFDSLSEQMPVDPVRLLMINGLRTH